VADAIGAALDAVFASTSMADCLEETLAALQHKNPQVKLETTRFLIRALKSTREAPQPAETKSIADAATKLLTESVEIQRAAGAEALGTLWKIMGDRMMGPHLEGLEEIRKTKVKEYYEAAEVKAKYKPKAVAPPPKAAPAPAAQKKTLGKRPGGPGPKKPAPAAAPAAEEPAAAPLQPKPTSRPATKLGGLKPKPGLAPPSNGLKKPGTTASPARRQVASPELDDSLPTPAAPKLGGLAGRSLAGRPLGKPAASAADTPSTSASGLTGLSSAERAELDELRAENERVRRQNEDMRAERTKLSSQIYELQNQNAQLIEDHTRDMLTIKAKETQLVRARSDAENAEEQVRDARREGERLKRELSRMGRAAETGLNSHGADIYSDSAAAAAGGGVNGGVNGRYGGATRAYVTSPPLLEGEGKENFLLSPTGSRPGSFAGERASKLGSPVPPTIGLRRAESGSSDSPASRAGAERRDRWSGDSSGGGGGGLRGPEGEVPRATTTGSVGLGIGTGTTGMGQSGGAESWRRAAEVTQNLKARIELMKVRRLNALQES